MVQIPIRGKHLGKLWTQVDDEDYESVVVYNWFLSPDGYAQRNFQTGLNKHTRLSLHRVVMGLVKGDGLHLDHINGDKLDNRKSNLRIVTHAQNMQNQGSRKGSSKYRGVCFKKETGRWGASFMVGGVIHFVGYFADEDEAGAAVSAARAIHMPFTREAVSAHT